MRNVIRLIAVVAIMVLGGRYAAEAHFRLLEPASWLIEDERGDPQKAGPCGGTNADYGKPSYAVTKVTGGSKLTSRCRRPSIIRATIASRWR
jgi:hypothetical protein